MQKLPKIFIASSSGDHSMKIGRTLKDILEDVAEVNCWWDEDVFRNGKIVLEVLFEFAKKSNLGIFIFNSDDEVTMGNSKYYSTRDNVLFEYGLFAGNVGKDRCFIIKPQHLQNFHLPTDLAGLVYLEFDPGKPIDEALLPIVTKIKHAITEWHKQSLKKYFTNFDTKEEPLILYDHYFDQPIEYARSFNLLLYMFSNEAFNEFRALDLAFNRWEETFLERKKQPSQIVNYSKDIIHSVQELYKKGNCPNFRRILVIPAATKISKEGLQVLRLLQSTERDSMASQPAGIIETRMLVHKDKFIYEFKQCNDFALFSGKNEEFAIVEKNLQYPNPKAEPGDACVIVTDPEALLKRKNFFDLIWEKETISINEYIRRNHRDDISNTICDAYDLLYKSINTSTNRHEEVSIIIETAYVELGKLADIRRKIPFERAFDLLNQITAIPSFADNIFLDAFINDFRPKSGLESECSELCEESLIDNSFEQLKDSVTEQFKQYNASAIIDQHSVTTFYMTKTRTKAIRNLKTLLVESPSFFRYDTRDKESRDIKFLLKNPKREITLGYEKDGSIVPNCALLMAQHYYDLFRYAYEHKRHHKTFWIFDFLIYSEKVSVEQGAALLKNFFTWPDGITLNIINCTYDEEGTGDIRRLTPIQPV